MAEPIDEDDADVSVLGDGQDVRMQDAYRREVRKRQRELISDVQKHREDMDLKEIVSSVQKLDTLRKEVVATKEMSIDSEGFKLLTNIGQKQAEHFMGAAISFDPSIFAEKLITYMGGRREGATGQDLDWGKLGNRAQAAFRKPPTLNFIHGALDLEPLKKRSRKAASEKKASSAVSKETRPKELVNIDSEEESTTKDVAHIYRYLKQACQQQQRMNYFMFLVDPHSFSHTVENMFHFSFLIKEGRAGITIGRDNLPHVYLPSETNEIGQSIKTEKSQTIISINMSDWKRAVEKFEITGAFIPIREEN